ncbi:MAG TPA: hypothetical protein DEF72_05550 [Gammaproteobacteria bacterium]|nr:hypothetical protein [Gammaproteobacteria bacterium]
MFLHFVALLTGGVLTANESLASNVQETAVQSNISCGPWPIYHSVARSSCEYPVIDKTKIDTVERGRIKLVDSCLICSDEACSARNRDDLESYDLFTCRMLFMVPLSVSTSLNRSSFERGIGKKLAQEAYLSPLSVTLSYSINESGRVADLRILRSDGLLNDDVVREMLLSGAEKVRFLPLLINGSPQRITEIESQIVLR